MANATELGMDALHELKSTDPPLWLTPSGSLSRTARSASKHLFSLLKPYSPKLPIDELLVDGFDAEQIWQQIDLQSQPLLAGLSKKVKYFEKNKEEISEIFQRVVGGGGKKVQGNEHVRKDEDFNNAFKGDEMGMDELSEDEEEEEEGEEEEEEDEEDKEKSGGGIEDRFLKINELEEYLENDEAREYGLDPKKKKKQEDKLSEDEDDEEEDEDDDENEDEDEEDTEDEDDEFGVFGDGGDEEDDDKLGSVRYEDFFNAKMKKSSKVKSKLVDGSDEDLGSDDEKQENLSTFEKELQKRRSEIEKMEEANLEPKTWTMQGEVTARSRPENSALEVDLDFEHNVGPPPVITEEVTASLEDMIKKRIIELYIRYHVQFTHYMKELLDDISPLETNSFLLSHPGQFDDIMKVSRIPTKAPRELKELDENKSKKGLADIYADEYVQQTKPDAAPISGSDELKKEASALFKKLCLKLDALAHFHFAPKPVIEEMSIQTNVPALAMEEIAPMAVSDAAMLAPEEVFSGKGKIKEEAELTQAERKRRRANKKRKFKAKSDERIAKKARDNSMPKDNDGKEEE